MHALKCILNKIKLTQVVSIMVLICIGSIGYCSASPWATHVHIIGSFAPIPIAVTLSSETKTVNHTGVEMYSDADCTIDTSQGFNIGSPPKFTFTSATTYYLGLSTLQQRRVYSPPSMMPLESYSIDSGSSYVQPEDSNGV